MGITDRHKKPGGFKKLINSLEVTPPQRRQVILDTMRAEDLTFVEDIEKCIFKFEEFVNLNDLMLCEFLAHVTDYKSLAVALFKSPAEIESKFKKNMIPAVQKQVRDEAEMIEKVTVGEQMAARFKLIELARAIEKENKIKLKAYNSKYPDET